VLDVCPISWPKTAVGAVAKSIKAVQVRYTLQFVHMCG
jgi:hypothetical protein